MGGCGQTSVETGKLEKDIEHSAQTNVRSVKCPDHVKAEPGASFRCDVEGADGTKATVKVLQKDAEGHLQVDLLNTHAAERRLGAVYRRTGSDIRVICPDIVVEQQGRSFECELRGADGTKATRRVDQTNDKGNVDFNALYLVPTGAVERRLGAVYRRTGSDIRVICPDIVVAEKGRSFDCELRGADGTKATARVDQTNDSRVAFAGPALVPVGTIEAVIARQIREEVDCPDVTILRPPLSLHCEVRRADGSTATAEVHVPSLTEPFTFKIKPGG